MHTQIETQLRPNYTNYSLCINMLHGREQSARTCSDCTINDHLITFHRELITSDRPKPILLVSAVVETAAETRDMYTAVTEP